jgi:hypothetical protein
MNKAGFIKGDNIIVKSNNIAGKIIDTSEETVLVELRVPSAGGIIAVSKIEQQWYTNDAVKRIKFRIL